MVFSDDNPILSFILAVLKKYSVIVISSDSVENALIGFSNIKYKKSIEEAISSINIQENDIILITGSLYLAGEVLNLN